jgi:hypothetical protein
MLLAAGISILLFAVAFAEDQQPGKEPNQKPEPNQKSQPAAPPAFQQKTMEVEQMREQARQRIRERMEQRRQQAWRGGAVDTNAIAQRKGRVDANLAGGIADANAAQRREAIVEQLLSQQEEKYRERLARLDRIRELAREQGDANTVERVDKLIKQDQQLHQVKMQRMSRQKEMMAGKGRLPGASRENLVRIEKVKEANVPDANKSVARPPVEKRQ